MPSAREFARVVFGDPRASDLSAAAQLTALAAERCLGADYCAWLGDVARAGEPTAHAAEGLWRAALEGRVGRDLGAPATWTADSGGRTLARDERDAGLAAVLLLTAAALERGDWRPWYALRAGGAGLEASGRAPELVEAAGGLVAAGVAILDAPVKAGCEAALEEAERAVMEAARAILARAGGASGNELDLSDDEKTILLGGRPAEAVREGGASRQLALTNDGGLLLVALALGATPGLVGDRKYALRDVRKALGPGAVVGAGRSARLAEPYPVSTRLRAAYERAALGVAKRRATRDRTATARADRATRRRLV